MGWLWDTAEPPDEVEVSITMKAFRTRLVRWKHHASYRKSLPAISREASSVDIIDFNTEMGSDWRLEWQRVDVIYKSSSVLEAEGKMKFATLGWLFVQQISTKSHNMPGIAQGPRLEGCVPLTLDKYSFRRRLHGSHVVSHFLTECYKFLDVFWEFQQLSMSL